MGDAYSTRSHGKRQSGGVAKEDLIEIYLNGYKVQGQVEVVMGSRRAKELGLIRKGQKRTGVVVGVRIEGEKELHFRCRGQCKRIKE